MRPRLKPLAALILLALQGCSMAPTYTVPSLDLPANYREQTSDGPWHSAQPEANAKWPVLNLIEQPQRRETLIAHRCELNGKTAYKFDIRNLGGRKNPSLIRDLASGKVVRPA